MDYKTEKFRQWSELSDDQWEKFKKSSYGCAYRYCDYKEENERWYFLEAIGFKVRGIEFMPTFLEFTPLNLKFGK